MLHQDSTTNSVYLAEALQWLFKGIHRQMQNDDDRLTFSEPVEITAAFEDNCGRNEGCFRGVLGGTC